MNIDALLSSALEALSEMSIDAFETACLKAGHTPVKRDDVFQMVPRKDFSTVGTNFEMTYRKTKNINMVDHLKSTEFNDSANDLTFVLAA